MYFRRGLARLGLVRVKLDVDASGKTSLLQKAIEDFSFVISNPEAASSRVVDSYLNRMDGYARLGRIDMVLADAISIIENPAANIDQLRIVRYCHFEPIRVRLEANPAIANRDAFRVALGRIESRLSCPVESRAAAAPCAAPQAPDVFAEENEETSSVGSLNSLNDLLEEDKDAKNKGKEEKKKKEKKGSSGFWSKFGIGRKYSGDRDDKDHDGDGGVGSGSAGFFGILPQALS